MRNLFLASLAATVLVSFSVADVQAGTPQSDLCGKDRPIFSQLEEDAGFIAKSLRDGFVKSRQMIKEYFEDWKQKQNYSETHPQPYMTLVHVVYSAILCADPADVSFTPDDPKSNKGGTFAIDYWRADTNEIYETARGHDITAKLIAGANEALNNNIAPRHRDQAIALFNTRALLEKNPMRIGFNSERKLELRAVTIPDSVSK